MNGPPQEGLDPKLKVLTELAPAEEVAMAIDAIDTNNDAIDPNDTAGIDTPYEEVVVSILGTASTASTVMGTPLLHPPQVGQDPKLLACVNDGDHGEDHERNIDTAAASAIVDYCNPPAAATMPVVQYELEQTAPPSPTKATVAATMLSIHRNVSSPLNDIKQEEQGGEAATATAFKQHEDEAATMTKQQPKSLPISTAIASTSKARLPMKNSNAKPKHMPNLTSSESLAEWNRIHANDKPSYNFFKKATAKKQEGSTTKPTVVPKIEELIESSKGRPSVAAGAIAASSGGTMNTPLFILNSNGAVATTIPPTVHTNNASRQDDPQSPSPALPPSHEPAAAALPPPVNNSNSNFWLQEEEERFLLGLRLYGWGQWKRIQTIVQTRTNKQIKSHAQKREKVNPSIKFKYGKGKVSRRGRISSKVLAEDARAMAIAGGSVEQVADAILSNDATIPSLDQAWRDVYGTNNGDGPNSRVRRYRGSISGQNNGSGGGGGGESNYNASSIMEKMIDNTAEDITDVAAMEHCNRQYMEQQAEHQAISEFAASSGTNHNPNVAPPLPNLLPTIHPPPSQLVAPAAAVHSSNTLPVHTHQTTPILAQTLAVPTVNNNSSTTNTMQNELSPSTQQNTDTNTLRPGMRIYSRNINGESSEWQPGTIYSAKVDPTKQALHVSALAPVPLIYHIQHDNGEENHNVPEEHVMSKTFYEEAIIKELEQCHAMPSTTDTQHHYCATQPLEMGTPVYCQWMDMLHPEMHGRWLPGTVHSYREIMHNDDKGNREYLYHILFDNDQEKRDVAGDHVLDRTEYHELTKLKNQMPPEERSKPIGEIYNLFLRNEHGDNNVDVVGDHDAVSSGTNGQNSNDQQHQQSKLGSDNPSVASGQGNVVTNGNNGEHQQTGQLDLLFTASQIATSTADSKVEEVTEALTTTRKRESSAMDNGHDDTASSKRKHLDVVARELVREQEEETTAAI